MVKLTWRPDIPHVKALENKKLVKVLNERYFRADGNETETIVFDHDAEYFEGLADAGMAEARAIVEALSKHGSIRLKRNVTSD